MGCFWSVAAAGTRAAKDARWMRGQLLAQAAKLPAGRAQALAPRLHFGTVPALRVPGALPSVLRAWQYTERRVVTATMQSPGGNLTMEAGRLDALYSWVGDWW